jgi:sec-independent protein translocase protein TatC
MSAISITRNLKLPRPPRPFRRAEKAIDEDKPMPLVDHLVELRDRLIRSVFGVMITTALSFVFIDRIIGLLINLAGDHRVQALNPTETFATYFKVAFSVGVAMAMPVLVYQMLRFFSPGLTRTERRAVYISIPFITLCFAAGVLFCYFVMLPSALDFLLGFGDPRIEKNVAISQYVGFVTNFLLAVGTAFELPVILFVLAKVGAVNYTRLARFRKYALLLSFLAAAIITPTPDPFNQALVGGPIFLLYELGTQLSRFARRSKAEEHQ